MTPREEFEAWTRGLGSNKILLQKNESGDYLYEWNAGAWRAWQEQECRHADALETVRLIEELRADEQILVVCNSATYHGDSLLDCLRQAAEAKKGAVRHGDT